MLNKFFKLLLITVISVYSAIAADYTAVKNQVNHLVDESTAILNNNSLSVETKAAKCGVLLQNNLDLDWMAKYALGRNKLTSAQIQQFNQVYSTYVVKLYSDLVKNYKGEKVQILNVRENGANEFMVNTQIVNANTQQQTKIDYLIRQTNNKSLKVADIITEGISMIDSQRSEFASIISNEGFDQLISSLKSKI